MSTAGYSSQVRYEYRYGTYANQYSLIVARGLFHFNLEGVAGCRYEATIIRYSGCTSTYQLCKVP